LDFERITAGTGLTWLVPGTPGIVAFGRYDFTELLNSESNQLLQDHELTIGGQKTFAFGRSHFLTTGSRACWANQPLDRRARSGRNSCSLHLQITRSLDADLLYRYAAQFYDEDGRVDPIRRCRSPLDSIRRDGCASTPRFRARNDSKPVGL